MVASFTHPKSGGGSNTYSFVWDAVGNIQSETMPGNNAVTSKTTTQNYATDGSYSQTEALRRPLVVTDQLGHATRYRYDVRGNTVTV